MASSDYLNIVSEFYDLSDPNTMNKLIMCNEAQKQTNIETLTNRLYRDIKNNIDQIDFGTIPMSKGDITKIDGYENLISCIDTMASLIKEYGQSTEQIDVISTGLDNIQKRTRIWQKAFAMNIEFPMIMYNTMTLAIVSAVTLLITTCIEYIKNADNTFSVSFVKASYIKNREHVLFVSLREFNAGCANGEMDKISNQCIKSNLVKVKEAYDAAEQAGSLNEFDAVDAMGIISDIYRNSSNKNTPIGKAIFIALGIAGLIALIKFGFFGIRRIVYYWFSLRQKVSDYLTVQAEFLQINAENLKRREEYKDNDEERKKVYAKQMKWVDRFKKWANFWMIKDKRARVEAKKRQEEDTKQKKDDDEDSDDGDGGIF